MKRGWEIKRLGEISEIMNGGTPDTTVQEFWDGVNLWITPKDMGKLESIYVDDTLRKITDEGLKNSSAKILPPNSIILSSRAPIGHLAINTKPISTNQGCKGLVPKKGIDTLFLYYFLTKSVDLLNSLGTGTTFKELSGSKLGTVEIPLPPLTEQQRIVAILREAFAAIAKAKANAEQNLKNAKELFDSYLQSVFENKGEGWEEKTLSELFDVKHGFAFLGEFFSDSGDYVLLTPGNFFEKGGYRDRGDKQKYYIGNIPPDFILKEGDLLVAMTEQAAGLLGSPIIVPESNKFLHNQRLGLVRPKSDIQFDNEFFYHVLNLKHVRKSLHDSGTGVKVRHTSPTKIGQVVICYPKSKTEQQTIVQKLDALSAQTKKLEAIYQQHTNDLDELKKSILQKAFNGELNTEKSRRDAMIIAKENISHTNPEGVK
jgi:type I restriction enzyme, S subunit